MLFIILPFLQHYYNVLRWANAMGAHVYRFIMPRIGLVPWMHMFIVLLIVIMPCVGLVLCHGCTCLSCYNALCSVCVVPWVHMFIVL